MVRSHGLMSSFVLSIVFCGLAEMAVSRCEANENSRREIDSGEFVSRHENVLGTSLVLRVHADSRQSAQSAERVVLSEIDRLSRIFSRYDSASELSRWCRGEIADGRVSTDLYGIFARSRDWNAKTAGAFDIRAQVYANLWQAAAKSGRMPTAPELGEARRLAKQPAWTDVPETRRLMRTGTASVSLDGIATGTIVDAAVERVLREIPEVRGILVDIGGDIRIAGEMETSVGVAPPRGDSETAVPISRLRLKNRAITTSGDTYRGFEIGGVHHSHIIDPKTGAPAREAASATVIAPTAETADALATAFCVLTPDESLRIASTVPGVECLILTHDGQRVASPGWPGVDVRERTLADIVQASLAILLNPAPFQDEAGKGLPMPLKVEFEIDQPDASRRYRKPYVAVWVEDKDGLTVRTLALWLQKNGSRWHPDLRRWWRDDQARKLLEDSDLIETVSRPTRPPGKYDVIWDGKDDSGAAVKPGQYTILIEAAREHGTYQLIRQEVTLGDKPFTKNLAGNVEIKSGRVIYGNALER